MKIAVLGSASSSVGKAPFKTARYHQWLEGKLEDIQRAHDFVPGEFQIWGCSPGCWAVVPRATRWFEVHRWEIGVPWFSPQYVQFLRDFKGPVYTGGRVPEIPGHSVYPIEHIEEKFSSYCLTSSLGLMLALAIDCIEDIRENRRRFKAGQPLVAITAGDHAIDLKAEMAKGDDDDVIGLWGVDMAANDEYAYQRPGCQFLVLEAMRRGIGVYLPAESDLMRPQPVYGISEWDHNYIKLTTRSRELNARAAALRAQAEEAKVQTAGLEGEQHALNYFVSTWCSPYGMLPGMVIRQQEGTGLGSGITSFDGRPIERMGARPQGPQGAVLEAMAAHPEVAFGRECRAALQGLVTELVDPLPTLKLLAERARKEKELLALRAEEERLRAEKAVKAKKKRRR